MQLSQHLLHGHRMLGGQPWEPEQMKREGEDGEESRGSKVWMEGVWTEKEEEVDRE